MQTEDRVRLLNMVEAAQTAQRFVAGRTRSELGTDQMLLFAVLRAIEVLGEAASKVSTRSVAQTQAFRGAPLSACATD